MGPLLYHIKDVMFYNGEGKWESKFVGLQLCGAFFVCDLAYAAA